MGKRYNLNRLLIFVLVVVFVTIYATAQSQKSIDSLNIFIKKSEHLDSILQKKLFTSLTYWEIVQVVETKIETGHDIPIHTIDNAIAWISHPEGTFTNCDSIGIYLADRLYKKSKNILQKIGVLKLQLEYIERTGQCFLKNHPNKFHELYFDLNKLEYELKIKNDYDYLIHTNMLGIEYAKQKNTEMAKYCFGMVIDYPYWKTHGVLPNMAILCRQQCILAGKSSLLLIRGDLKKLEQMYFLAPLRAELDPILKEYIEELGGKFKTVEEKIKEEQEEEKKFPKIKKRD